MPESQQNERKAIWKDDYLKWICSFTDAEGRDLFELTPGEPSFLEPGPPNQVFA